MHMHASLKHDAKRLLINYVYKVKNLHKVRPLAPSLVTASQPHFSG